MYKVIRRFMDLQDNNHVYNTGDNFPREGIVVGADRIKELSSSNNLIGEPVIKSIGEASPLTKEDHKKLKTDETQLNEVEAKKKPRRRKKDND